MKAFRAQQKEKINICREKLKSIKKKMIDSSSKEERRKLKNEELKEAHKCGCNVRKEGMKHRIDHMKQQIEKMQERYNQMDCDNPKAMKNMRKRRKK